MTEKESKFDETKMNLQGPVIGAAGKVEGDQIININNNYGTAHSQSGHDSEAELNVAKTSVNTGQNTIDEERKAFALVGGVLKAILGLLQKISGDALNRNFRNKKILICTVLLFLSIMTIKPIEGLISKIRTEKTLEEISEFKCFYELDKNGGYTYTLKFRLNKSLSYQPWIRIVKSLGDGWNRKKRCDEIADRLQNIHKYHQIIGFSAREDSKTEKLTFIICAITKSTINNKHFCPEVLTLLPGEEPEKHIDSIIEAMFDKNSFAFENSNSQSIKKGYNIDIEEGRINVFLYN